MKFYYEKIHFPAPPPPFHHILQVEHNTNGTQTNIQYTGYVKREYNLEYIECYSKSKF